MADTMNGVPIGDLPGIESVPDDSMLVVEFLGKAYSMPGTVLKQLFQDILDAMGSSVDDVTEARLTAAIETVLASGKYNGVSPIVEVTTDESGKSVLHVVDAYGIKDYPVEVKGATDAVRYNPQELTDAQKAQARENIGAAAEGVGQTVIAEITGSVNDGYDVTIDGKSVTDSDLKQMVERGNTVIGVTVSNPGNDIDFPMVSIVSFSVPNNTTFQYDARNAQFSFDSFEKHYKLTYTDGVWVGSFFANQFVFSLFDNYIDCDGKYLTVYQARAILTAALQASLAVHCYQHAAVFYTEDGLALTPPPGTQFFFDFNKSAFVCEYEGYEYSMGLYNQETGLFEYIATAKRTSTYKVAESKGDDLEEEDGKLFLLSAGERISEGVTLPTSGGKDGTTFTPNVDEYGDLSWTNNGGLPNPATVNIRGPRGYAGLNGLDGADGEDGGTTYVSSIADMGTYTRIGLTESRSGATQYVDIPHGADGATGPQGPAGPAGESIYVSSVTDYDTYTEIGITHGQSGSEQLVRIPHGKDGEDGGTVYVSSVTDMGTYTRIGLKESKTGATQYIDIPHGADGAPGPAGEAATIEEVTAESDGSYLAQPTVTVTTGGTAQKRTFHFAFKGLRGLSGSGTGGGGVPGDLAENDPNSASYIYNRTHWKEVYDGPEGEVISETSVAFTSNIKTITGAMSDAIHAGGLYIVTWNGVDYRCIGKASSDGNYIGNGSFMNAGNITFEDTGEPFCVLQFGGSYYMVYKADKTAETVTVKVVGKKETVWHKLDSKYLNEALQFGTGELVEVLPETMVEVDPEMGSGMLPDVLDVIDGNTYKVNWNGTEFECTAQVYVENDISGVCLGNLSVMTGGTDTGEPFVIVCFDATTAAGIGAGVVFAPLDGSASVTLSITGEVVKTIDPKYLPKSLQFGEIQTEIFPETTFEQAEIMATVPLIEGGIYKVKYNGVEYICTCRSYTNDGLTIYVLGNYDAFTGESEEGTGEPFVFLSAPSLGVCMVNVFDESVTSVTMSISGPAIKKLDNKYLDLEWTPSKKPATRVEVFPETTVNATGDTIPLTEEFMASAEDKAPYIVTWNGREYICNAMLLSNHFAIGNLYMVNPDLAPNTGEPFLFFTTGQNLIIYYMDEGAVTFKIDRGYYDTLPYEFAPANYTIPYDLKANDSQGTGEALAQAEYVLKHGGKVFGTVDGEPVEILHLIADTTDFFHKITWRVLSNGIDKYGNIYTQVSDSGFKAQTPAVDRKDILLRYNNNSASGNAPPQKFKFTVDKNGNLMSANEDGTNQKAYLNATPVTSADNGKFLRVVDGAWAAVALTDVSEVGA